MKLAILVLTPSLSLSCIGHENRAFQCESLWQRDERKASAITGTTNQAEASGGLSNKLWCSLLPGTVLAKKPERI